MHRFVPVSFIYVMLITFAGCLGEVTSGFPEDEQAAPINVNAPDGPGDRLSEPSSTLPDMGEAPGADMSDTDMTPGEFCGDGQLSDGEVCDANCPTSCDDGNTCTADVLTGSAATCDAVCSNDDIVACVDGDGCCPDMCDASTDDDCSPSCGDGIVDENETCDGNCPPTCDDADACTVNRMTGSADRCNVQCSTTPVTACVDNDGCCPVGCNMTNDNDCSAVCGNGVIEDMETCDPIADCPSECDDSDACTTDTLIGDPQMCNSACIYDAITACVDGDGCCAPGCNANNDDDCAPICGNGVVEPGETCDPTTSCPAAADCNDLDACTVDSYSGSAATCDAQCSYAPITACVDGDGCCPTGCTFANDDDCPVVINCADPASWPSGWVSLEAAIFDETNARRTSPQTCNGASFPPAPALLADTRLREAARCHAIDMASNNFFSHTGSSGSSVGQRATAAGYVWNRIAENIAAGNSTAVAIVNQWMNSPSGHCEAIMNPNYEDLGIGYAYDQSATYDHYSVQVFGRD